MTPLSFVLLAYAASLLFLSLSPQSSYRGSSCVDQAANHGRACHSPDRTHDHDRGQRRKPTGPASALRRMMTVILLSTSPIILLVG